MNTGNSYRLLNHTAPSSKRMAVVGLVWKKWWWCLFTMSLFFCWISILVKCDTTDNIKTSHETNSNMHRRHRSDPQADLENGKFDDLSQNHFQKVQLASGKKLLLSRLF